MKQNTLLMFNTELLPVYEVQHTLSALLQWSLTYKSIHSTILVN